MKVRLLHLAVAVALLVAAIGPAAATQAAGTAQPKADKVIFFAADGLRQDLVQNYA
ncbi:MAG: hypothetical protein JNK29_14185, partial [Anaerolineales bacterium]|nr:hypothetical protein [Anaerolineales bacterium]